MIRIKKGIYLDTLLIQAILMPKAILVKFLSQKKLVAWNHSYLKRALAYIFLRALITKVFVAFRQF